MTPIFFVTAGVVLIVALLLVLWPLQRNAAKSKSRVREAAGKLRALNEARTAGSDGEGQSAALQAAIDELLAATGDFERRGARPGIYAGVAVVVFVPLAATAMYRWWGSPHAEHVGAYLQGDTAVCAGTRCIPARGRSRAGGRGPGG